MKTLEATLKVKPLSANKMYYRGKRSKTKEYLDYQHEIRDELIGVGWPFEDKPVSLKLNVGLSNRAADLDNVLKPLLDTLQSIFEEFNDNKVYHIDATKLKVEKGEEHIVIKIERYINENEL